MVIVNEPQLPCLHPWDQLSFVTTTTTATWVYGVWPTSYPTHSTIQRCHPTLHGSYNPACFHLVWTSDLMERKDRSQSHVVVTAEGGTNFKSCLVGRSLNPAPAIFLLDNAALQRALQLCQCAVVFIRNYCCWPPDYWSLAKTWGHYGNTLEPNMHFN